MAATAPAITPDARRGAVPSTQRSVSFGLGPSNPKSATSSNLPVHTAGNPSSASSANNGASSGGLSREEALRLYADYRAAAPQFPSYDRLRFVRLPRQWLPAGLQDAEGTAEGGAEGGEPLGNEAIHGEVEKLQHWPALVYQNLAELVRDMPKSEHNRMLKAKLILDYRKQVAAGARAPVARLIGWHAPEDEEGANNPFAEPTMELIELAGTSLEDNEAKHAELVNFVDAQLEYEAACEGLLAKHTEGDPDEADAEVLGFALRFRRAVDVALNCLALDVGGELLPPRRDDEVALMTPMHGVEGCAQSKPVVEKRVLEVETARPKSHGAAKEGESTARPVDKENRANMSKKGRTESKRKSAKKGLSGQASSKKKSPKKPQAKKDKATSSTQPKAAPAPAKPAPSKANKEKPSQPASRQSSRPPKPSSKTTSGRRTFNFDNVPAPEAAAPAPSTNHVVEDDVSWKDLWTLMKKSGWTWKGGSGLMVDYYYILPGRTVKNGARDVDYFESAEGAQEYARTVYGWGTVGRAALTERIEEHGKYAGETVPPLAEGCTIGATEPWRDAWQKMLQSGWTWRAGSGLMMDYYYVKPGCNVKGGAEGREYFCKVEDAQKFAKRNYGWRGEEAVEDHAKRPPVSLGGRLDDKPKAVAKRPLTLGGRVERAVHEKRQRVEKFAKKVAENTAAMKRSRTEAKKEAEVRKAEEPADDDDQSTFTTSGYRSKALFVNESADLDVPPLKQAIDAHEPWRDAWQKMRDSGWTWKVGSGLMTDYYYIKPGRNTKGGIKGQDYFESEDEVRQFAMRNYGWRGDGRRSLEGASGDFGGRKRRTSSDDRNSDEEQGKRQRVEKAKQHSNVQKARSPKKEKAVPPPPPRPTWRELQADGWRAVGAAKYNNLHDWYYVRPGADPGDKATTLGMDYFLCEDDAIESVIRSASSTSKKSASDAKAPTKPTATNPGLSTPADCRTKPQDPAIPLLSSPEPDSPTSPSQDYYDWTNLWPVLQRVGWTIVKAGKYNKLHDWYYVRPNRDPGHEASVLGRHYFTCQEDVIEFVRKGDEESTRKAGSSKKPRESVGVMLGAFEEEAIVATKEDLFELV